MTYTNRLKLAILADLLFAAGLGAIYFLVKTRLFNNFGINLTVVVILGLLCIAASFHKESGECRKWRNIWKDPVWQIIAYIILAVALIISIFVFPEYEYRDSLLFLLIRRNRHKVLDPVHFKNRTKSEFFCAPIAGIGNTGERTSVFFIFFSKTQYNRCLCNKSTYP